jgi:hypothetical protein
MPYGAPYDSPIGNPYGSPFSQPNIDAVIAIAYDLKATFTASNQTFTDAQVLDTAAEGVETGSLTVVDTSTGTVKIVGNELEIDPSGTWNTTGLYSNVITNTPGKAIFATIDNDTVDYNAQPLGTNIAGSIAQTTQLFYYQLNFDGKMYFKCKDGAENYLSAAVLTSSYTADTDYPMAIILGGFNAAGKPYIDGDTIDDFSYGVRAVRVIDGNWVLEWVEPRTNENTIYAVTISEGKVFRHSNDFLIPTNPLTPSIMFQPIFMDTFQGTNDDQLVSNHTPEVVDSATGTGNPWESGSTTWTIQGNAASNTGYVATLNTAFLTDDMSISEGLFDINITGANNQTGLVLALDSVASPANYVEVYYDFSDGSVKCVKTVVGTPTSLIDVTTTYVAGAQLRAILDHDSTAGELKLKVYYNNALIGTEQTISDAGIVGNTRHGIMSVDSANTLENFTVHNRTNAAWDAEITAATGGIY